MNWCPFAVAECRKGSELDPLDRGLRWVLNVAGLYVQCCLSGGTESEEKEE